MNSLLLWNVAWSALIAVLVFGVGYLPAMKRRPALMHLLWFGVLLRLVVPAVIAVPLLPDNTSLNSGATDVAHVAPQNVSVETALLRPIPVIDEPASRVPTAATIRIDFAAICWTFALLVAGLLLALSLWRIGRLLRLERRSEDAPSSLVQLTEQLSIEMRLSRTPRVRIVDGLASPSVWGVGWRATILLPRHLVAALDESQWSCVLAHELAHLVRGDFWFNSIAAGVLHVFWWNPVAWWAARELRAWQESSCDALALSRQPQSRRIYAETLLQVVDSWRRPNLFQPHAALGFGGRSVLTRRFEMIANASVRPQTAVISTACLCLLGLTFFCLPVRGEKDEPASKAERKTAASDEQDSETNASKNDEATRTMTIRVVDPAGNPVEGVRIFRNHVYKLEGVEKPKIENKDYRTDVEGKAVITLAGASVDLRLWATMKDYIPLHAMWAKQFQSDGDQIPQEFTFELQKGTKIGGVVKNEKGEPIEGVRVEVMAQTALQFLATNAERPGKRPVISAYLTEGDGAIVTNAGGRWELTNVPPEASPVFESPDEARRRFGGRRGEQKILLRLSHRDYAASEWGSLQLEQGVTHESLRDQSATIVMARAANDAEKKSVNNLKHIMYALHIYHEKHNTFPPAVLYGKNNEGGKHPHSWRVALLPYLEQMALYESYKFDEPWDSPANKDVMAKIPDTYRHPLDNPKSLNSSYFVLVGNLIDDDSNSANLQTLFSSKRGVRISQILDGTSNTAAVFEANRDIPWTKPQDIAYNPDGKLPEIGGFFEGNIFQIGRGDGTVHTSSPETLGEKALKAQITPAGMEILE